MLGSRLNGIKTHVHNMWHVGSGGEGGGVVGELVGLSFEITG